MHSDIHQRLFWNLEVRINYRDSVNLTLRRIRDPDWECLWAVVDRAAKNGRKGGPNAQGLKCAAIVSFRREAR